ncbi:MAG: anaerobic glycerol-3-phosphate dehydrogenase subunit B, partial [Chloroflexi bacterium]|nr:anaerobic glycerol-3-phosphate dehydrogenase subunit B [Chloroflexota bacterium]
MLDLLVIGAGLSGLMAAYVAARNGRQVKVVAKGLGGALHWSAGTIDVLGYVPGESEKPVLNPAEAINNLDPNHPYAQLKSDKVFVAIETFKQLTHEIELPYVGAANPAENLLLPSPVGAVRPTFLAPKSLAAGDLKRQEPMVIVGFSGLRDFYPELIAENLEKQGHPARAIICPLDVLTARKDSNTVHLAEGLEDPKQLQKLAAAIKPQLKKGERVGLPAILGMDGHTAVYTTLEKLLGVPVFEIPTLPPSVPGIRLYKA